MLVIEAVDFCIDPLWLFEPARVKPN